MFISQGGTSYQCPPAATRSSNFIPEDEAPQISPQARFSWSGLAMYKSLTSSAPCRGIYSSSPSLPHSLGKDNGGKAPSEGFTHHWGISEAFDGLEDAPSYGPHGEGPSTVIHYPPGTGEKNRGGNIKSHPVKPCKWVGWIQLWYSWGEDLVPTLAHIQLPEQAATEKQQY